MDKDTECPICYTPYGEQEDGSFLCKDGKENSGIMTPCKHYICVNCCWILMKLDHVACPLCREDWTHWIHSHYYSDDEYPLYSSDEEEEAEESEEEDEWEDNTSGSE